MPQIELPFIYQNVGIAPRKRNEGQYAVLTRGLFDVHEVSSADFLETVEKVTQDPQRENPHAVSRTVYRTFEDRFFQKATDLTNLATTPLKQLPDSLKVPSNFVFYGDHYEVHPKEKVRNDLVVQDGEEESYQALQASIDKNILLCEGELFEISGEPAWGIWLWPATVLVHTTTLNHNPHYSFPCDHLTEAVAFAEEIAQAENIAVSLDVTHHYEIRIPILPRENNPLVLATLRIAEECANERRGVTWFGEAANSAAQRFLNEATPENALLLIEALRRGETQTSWGVSPYMKREIFERFLEHLPEEFLPQEARITAPPFTP